MQHVVNEWVIKQAVCCPYIQPQRPLLGNSIDRVFKKLYSLIYTTLMEMVPYGRKEKRRSIRQRD